MSILSTELPGWADPKTLQWIALGSIALIFYVMFKVMRFVQKMMVRAVVLVVLAGLALGLWFQRAELGDCVDVGTCRLFGVEVEVPRDQG